MSKDVTCTNHKTGLFLIVILLLVSTLPFPFQHLPLLTSLNHLLLLLPCFPIQVSSTSTNSLPLRWGLGELLLLILGRLLHIQHILWNWAPRRAEDIGDGTEVRSVFNVEECYGFSWTTGSTGTTYSVDITRDSLGEVYRKVEDLGIR